MAICDADAVVRYADLSDPDWDLLEVLTRRAAAVIENYCGCSFTAAQHDELYDASPGQQELALRRYPVISVSAVYDGVNEIGSGRLLTPDEYILDASAGILRLRKGSFTPGRASVGVVYTAGYAQAPESVVQAAVMLVADWYRNRPDGRALREGYDGYAATYAADAIPPQVAALLEPYRRRVLA
jgi:uncharacterized phiE125 gp8 family phage protein